MTPETQGFAFGVLVCLFGWALIRLAALTIDNRRTEHAAAELDREHPPASDADWEQVREIAKPDPVIRRLDVVRHETAMVPLLKQPLRSVPTQRDGIDR